MLVPMIQLNRYFQFAFSKSKLPLELDSHVAENFSPALFQELLRFKMKINGF